MTFNELSTEALKAQIELLKKTIPQTYAQTPVKETEADKLFAIIKKSLLVIEAQFFQNKELFTHTSALAYTDIIQSLSEMGYSYQAHPEIVKRTERSIIIKAQLPMQRAKGGIKKEINSGKKAG